MKTSISTNLCGAVNAPEPALTQINDRIQRLTYRLTDTRDMLESLDYRLHGSHRGSPPAEPMPEAPAGTIRCIDDNLDRLEAEIDRATAVASALSALA